MIIEFNIESLGKQKQGQETFRFGRWCSSYSINSFKVYKAQWKG